MNEATQVNLFDTSIITSFSGEYSFLSNFYPAPTPFDNVLWPTSEHAYVAAKTTCQNERAKLQQILLPGKAKRYGRTVTLRPDWAHVKLAMMEDIVNAKFTHNPELAEKLVATDPKLIMEGNQWHDNFFGKCRCQNCHGRKFYNHLGRILMNIRKNIKRQ